MYTKAQEFMAEFFGTMFILLFGCGVVAMNNLFNLGGYTNITIAWGVGVFLGILVSNRISGAHLNPAVTLALAATKRFPTNKILHYIIAQMLGGFVGAAIVYYFYAAKLVLIDPSLSHSAGIFTTFPAVSAFMPSFMAELIASAILLFGILAIVEHFNNEGAGWLAPFAIGGLIVALGMSFGGMHGYAMNPARDLSPRIFISLMHFSNTGFENTAAWLPPVLGSVIGAIVGAVVYSYTIGQKPTLYKTDAESH
ncbi:MAG: aquaporin [Gammaproteobacteria bacterium]|jgi:glycerol uptake facilitator protein|nr:aquaporin [Gammaproteobacteria bacterium]